LKTAIYYRDSSPNIHQYRELYLQTDWNIARRASLVDLARSISNSWAVITAWEGDRLVGSGRVVSDGALYAVIYDLIVHTDYQNQNIGSTILSELIARIEEAGIHEIQLFSARGKTEFYEKRGFQSRPGDAPGMAYRM